MRGSIGAASVRVVSQDARGTLPRRFALNGGRYQHISEERGEEPRRVDLGEGDQRTGIGDDHAVEAASWRRSASALTSSADMRK
jgi:hypothetical protein